MSPRVATPSRRSPCGPASPAPRSAARWSTSARLVVEPASPLRAAQSVRRVFVSTSIRRARPPRPRPDPVRRAPAEPLVLVLARERLRTRQPQRGARRPLRHSGAPPRPVPGRPPPADARLGGVEPIRCARGRRPRSGPPPRRGRVRDDPRPSARRAGDRQRLPRGRLLVDGRGSSVQRSRSSAMAQGALGVGAVVASARASAPATSVSSASTARGRTAAARVSPNTPDAPLAKQHRRRAAASLPATRRPRRSTTRASSPTRPVASAASTAGGPVSTSARRAGRSNGELALGALAAAVLRDAGLIDVAAALLGARQQHLLGCPGRRRCATRPVSDELWTSVAHHLAADAVFGLAAAEDRAAVCSRSSGQGSRPPRCRSRLHLGHAGAGRERARGDVGHVAAAGARAPLPTVADRVDELDPTRSGRRSPRRRGRTPAPSCPRTT